MTARLAVAILMILIVSMGCNKEEKDREQVENLTVSNTDTLEYSLGGFGDEEGASILKHPAHYELSELQHTISTGEVIYRYKADSAFVGTDYVELRSARGSDGASANTDILITKLNITVTQ